MGKYADRYIRQATKGLTRKVRLDRAAELRTHLLERTKKYILEGFSAEEAEYLAVEHMGPVAEPRDTRKLAVWLSAALLLAFVSLAVWREFLPDSVAHASWMRLEPNSLDSMTNVKVRLGESARYVYLSMVEAGEARTVAELEVKPEWQENLRRFPALSVNAVVTGRDGFDPFLVVTAGAGTYTANPPLDKREDYTMTNLYDSSFTQKEVGGKLPTLLQDAWLPLVVYGPFGTYADALQNSSTALYVYVSPKKLEANDLPAVPSADAVAQRFPYWASNSLSGDAYLP